MGLLCCAFGCSGGAEDDASADPRAKTNIAQSNISRVAAESVPESDVRSVAAANNAFAVDLYAQVLKDGANKNVLTSPISASLALTMTYAGANGATKAEMQQVLHLVGPSDEAAFAGQNALSQALASRAAAALGNAQTTATRSGLEAPSPADYELQVVNSVWGAPSPLPRAAL